MFFFFLSNCHFKKFINHENPYELTKWFSPNDLRRHVALYDEQIEFKLYSH